MGASGPRKAQCPVGCDKRLLRKSESPWADCLLKQGDISKLGSRRQSPLPPSRSPATFPAAVTQAPRAWCSEVLVPLLVLRPSPLECSRPPAAPCARNLNTWSGRGCRVLVRLGSSRGGSGGPRSGPGPQTTGDHSQASPPPPTGCSGLISLVGVGQDGTLWGKQTEKQRDTGTLCLLPAEARPSIPGQKGNTWGHSHSCPSR